MFYKHKQFVTTAHTYDNLDACEVMRSPHLTMTTMLLEVKLFNTIQFKPSMKPILVKIDFYINQSELYFLLTVTEDKDLRLENLKKISCTAFVFVYAGE